MTSSGGEHDQATRWCPQCGDEYRPGFVVCSDCGVPLVAEPTHAKRQRVDEPQGHEQVEYDLSDWPQPWRESLEFLVRGAGIPFVWELGTTMLIPRAHQEAVDGLIDYIEHPAEGPAGDDPNQWEPSGVWLHGADVEPGKASALRRLAGYVLDSFIEGVVLIPCSITLPVAGASNAVAIAAAYMVDIAYWVPTTAMWGRTPGKFIVRTRVEDNRSEAPPGWKASVIRYAIPRLSPLLILFLSGVVELVLAWLWAIAVYAPILGNDRVGLHDRAARTVVVRRLRASDLPRSTQSHGTDEV